MLKPATCSSSGIGEKKLKLWELDDFEENN